MDEMLDFDFDGQKGRDEASVLSKLSKSKEEIEALVVPDDTPELERHALFLAPGQKVQKESVIVNLVRTLRTYRAEAVDRLVPVLTVSARCSARAPGRPATRALGELAVCQLQRGEGRDARRLQPACAAPLSWALLSRAATTRPRLWCERGRRRAGLADEARREGVPRLMRGSLAPPTFWCACVFVRVCAGASALDGYRAAGEGRRGLLRRHRRGLAARHGHRRSAVTLCGAQN